MQTIMKVKCNECGAEYYIQWIKYDRHEEYCPNCGLHSEGEAKLRLEEVDIKEVLEDEDVEG